MSQKILRKICVTGGIACGKSSVGKVLRNLHVPVIEADEVCHELLCKSRSLIDRVVSVFGTAILNRNSAIDRRILGRIVFADESKRKKLNALMHPAARRAIDAWFKTRGVRADKDRQPRRFGPNAGVAIVPLVYEAGWENDWDAVICVAAPLSLQISRLREKGLTERDARGRVAAQLPLAEKIKRADYVIFNAGTIAGLRQQTELMFRSINLDISRK